MWPFSKKIEELPTPTPAWWYVSTRYLHNELIPDQAHQEDRLECEPEIHIICSDHWGTVICTYEFAATEAEAMTQGVNTATQYLATPEGKQALRDAEDREHYRWISECKRKEDEKPVTKGDVKKLIKTIEGLNGCLPRDPCRIEQLLKEMADRIK
jgi:hypothetical protein